LKKIAEPDDATKVAELDARIDILGLHFESGSGATPAVQAMRLASLAWVLTLPDATRCRDRCIWVQNLLVFPARFSSRRRLDPDARSGILMA
jgi:hypothetical protein